MNPIQIAAYLFLALTWGLSFAVLLHMVDAFGWAGAVALRSLLAGTLLYMVARTVGRKLDFSIGWKRLSLVGATTVAGQLVFLSIATPLIGTAMASIFVAAIPIFSMGISHVWGLEKISKYGVFGVFLGFVGIVMLIGFPSVPISDAFILGCICSLLSAFFAALGSNYVSLRLKNVGSWEITIGSFITGGLMTLPLMLFVPIPAPITGEGIGWLLINTIIASALNYVLYFWLVAKVGATKTISVEFLVTVVAVTIGTVWLGERLSIVQFGGAVIIVLGCMFVLGLGPTKLLRET